MDEKIKIGKYSVSVYRYDTVIVGSGASGLAAANELARGGDSSFCLITEGRKMGTSRNTGSDKQTYYKLSVAGEGADSVRRMARDLFAGGCVNGDTALCQAALSARGFFNLVNLGIPFPSNEFGEYIGYKTDHDDTLRAVSAGPLTSRYMVEKLENEANKNGVRIFDGFLAAEILTDGNKVSCLFALDIGALSDIRRAFCVFMCKNIILATGGPAGLYRDSAYPHSQTGCSGMAFRAGAVGANLTEWQYGIASVGFRWNLSGSFQQVLPRYFSALPDGSGEREFLSDFLDDKELLHMTFLKGYQWPFDVKKAQVGSSRIDIAVFKEISDGRKVFMDFTKNPIGGRFDFSLLSSECKSYLEKSGALLRTPVERLLKLNKKAYDVYKDNDIDLKAAPVEICVAAQHNNGGLAVDAHCRTAVEGLYAVGEAAASFGIYRPGGAALNATQTDACRAAAHILEKRMCADSCGGVRDIDSEKLLALMEAAKRQVGGRGHYLSFRQRLQKRMSEFGAFVRDPAKLKAAVSDCLSDMEGFEEMSGAPSPAHLPETLRNRDLILAQFVYLSAMLDYIEKGGSGRGSFAVEEDGDFRPFVSGDFADVIQYSKFCENGCKFEWLPTRPVPDPETWFESELEKQTARCARPRTEN